MTSDHLVRPAAEAAEKVLLRTCGWVAEGESAAPPGCRWRGVSDRDRLRSGCDVLRRHGVATCSAVRLQDPAQVRGRLRDLLLRGSPGADGAFLFWTAAEDERCFGGDGNLAEPLVVHTAGDGTEIAAQAAMAMVGLAVRAGPAAGTLLVARR